MGKQNHVNLNLNVRGLAPSATLAINEKSAELRAQGKPVYRLGLGQSPFPVPERVVQSLRDNAHKKDYLPVSGLNPLREAVAGFNERQQGIRTDPGLVMIGPGSKELIFILQLVYYGDLVIPTPSWVSYSPQARIVGRHVYWVPTSPDNYWRMSPDQLEKICRTDPDKPRIAILNYPSNPTGYTYPLDRLKELARVARKYNVILVSDEIYGLLHFRDQHVSVARFYPEGTIISSGLSKWCGAGGWRLGTFSFPENLEWLHRAMTIVASESFTSTSAPIQYAAITAFDGGEDIEEYLHHSRRILRTLAQYAIEQLKKMHVDLPMPHGAFYLFPDFGIHRESLAKKGIFTSVELCHTLLKETGVAMLPGYEFGRDPDELTARIALVDFEGEEALKVAAAIDQGKNLNGAFVQQVAPRLVEAFDRMAEWFRRLDS
ncbi:MAG: pyridoxal phosphate-dependent aminotransferase [Bacteroidales bacterium]